MAPYGACEVTHSTLDAMLSSKQSDFERNREGKRKVLSDTLKFARATISSANWLRSTPEPCFRAPCGCLCESTARGLCFRVLSNTK